MSNGLRNRIVILPLAGLLFAGGGCGDGPGGVPTGTPPPSVPGAPVVGAAAPEGAGASPTIREVMAKVAKGPNSLTTVIGKELKDNPPAWDTIQGQTRELARLAAALGKNDPPKGSKESWTKLTAQYAESASALDRGAQAKDKDASVAAHTELANSCMECHREHRRMGPGMGPRPGGFPGGSRGPRPGGPPGGPPSPPPAGEPPR